MTSIDRQRFISDLSSVQLSVSALPPPIAQAVERAGISPAELDAIAGQDHVIRGDAELGQLYDRLVASEARQQPSRPEARIDHARALYDAARSPVRDPTATPTAPTPIDPGASRGRPTGILGTAATRSLVTGLPERAPLLTRADYVRGHGEASARTLDAAAQRNVLGPEAGAQRRIRAQTEATAQRVEALETRAAGLPSGSAERRAVEAQIDAEVRSFENMVNSELVTARQARQGNGGTFDGIVRRLPPYAQESIRREGIVIPGVPGAVTPRFSTPGLDWRIKF